MKPTLLVYILGFLFILAMAGFIMQSCENRKLNRESENTKRMVIRSQKRTLKQIDSMAVEQKIVESKVRALTLQKQTMEDELLKERALKNQFKVKYEKSKNTPVPQWDHASLDSLLDAITR